MQKAEHIAALFRERRQIDILPADLMPADLGEAYAIRAAFEAIERPRRGEVAGYKIGLTTPIMQKLCGVDEPCYGAIFASEVHNRRTELPVRNYCRLGIETEIAMRLGEDLPNGGGRDRVAAAVEALHGGDRTARGSALTTSGSSAAAVVPAMVERRTVIGTPVTEWRRRDLSTVSSYLTISGREIGAGKGGDVMGNPLNALAWLADKLAAAGTPLKRGMIVLTGSMVPIQFPAAGDHALVEVGGLGTAELIAT
jgi:2-keto-4-pentenoate hydratase